MLTTAEHECLIAFTRHYPRIVYLSYVMWRKIHVKVDVDCRSLAVSGSERILNGRRGRLGAATDPPADMSHFLVELAMHHQADALHCALASPWSTLEEQHLPLIVRLAHVNRDVPMLRRLLCHYQQADTQRPPPATISWALSNWVVRSPEWEPTGRIQLARQFLSLGADISVPHHEMMGWNGIHCASVIGDVEMVELFLTECPTLLDVPDDYGRRPIHLACARNDRTMVKFLLQWGALTHPDADAVLNAKTPGDPPDAPDAPDASVHPDAP